MESVSGDGKQRLGANIRFLAAIKNPSIAGLAANFASLGSTGCGRVYKISHGDLQGL